MPDDDVHFPNEMTAMRAWVKPKKGPTFYNGIGLRRFAGYKYD